MAAEKPERAERLLVDIYGAADLLGIGYGAVRRLSLEGRLPFVLIGKRRFYSPEAIKNWIATKSAGGAK